MTSMTSSDGTWAGSYRASDESCCLRALWRRYRALSSPCAFLAFMIKRSAVLTAAFGDAGDDCGPRATRLGASIVGVASWAGADGRETWLAAGYGPPELTPV